MKVVVAKSKSSLKRIFSLGLFYLLSIIFLISGSPKGSEKKDCRTKKVYGPPPCHSDQQCVEKNGEGWYCNKNHSYNDGCGGKISWPVCSVKNTEDTTKEKKIDK